MSRLDHRPSNPAYYIEDCRISTHLEQLYTHVQKGLPWRYIIFFEKRPANIKIFHGFLIQEWLKFEEVDYF